MIGSLSLPTLVQRITIDTSSARTAEAQLGGTWGSIEAGTARAGAALTKGVTLPLLAVGAASVIMATDFGEKMTQIGALVGIPRAQLQAWEGDVRRLAVEHGKSAVEAADALYFITSAGIKGKDAIDALDASLAASRVGLGDVGAIADAVTSAMNAYSKSGLTAREATDVLVAAVREGKLEAAELAPALGNILPLASAMGVSFQQVAGIMAVFSRTGMGAAEGATSLQAVLSTLLKPTDEARKVLDGAGLSMEELRKRAGGPEGLIGVMRLLDSTFRDNDEALSMVVPNVRAMRGVMNALAQEGGVVDGVLEGVANSSGDLDRALAVTAQDGADKMRRAWAQIKDVLLGIGLIIGPVVADIASGIASVVGVFEKLPGPVQEGVVWLGAVAALSGPMLSLTSRVVGLGQRLFETMQMAKGVGMEMSLMANGMSRFGATALTGAGAAGLLAAAAVGTLYVLGAFGSMTSGVNVELAKQVKNTAELRGELGDYVERQRNVNAEIDRYREIQRNAGAEGRMLTDQMVVQRAQSSVLSGNYSIMNEKARLLAEGFKELAQSDPEAAQRFIAVAANAGLSSKEIDRFATILQRQIEKQEAANFSTAAAATALVNEGNAAQLTAGQVNALVEAEIGRQNAQLAAEGSLLAVERAQLNYDKVMADGAATSLDRRDAELQLRMSWQQAAAAAGEKAAADAVGATESEKAAASTRAQIETLSWFAGTLAPDSPLRVQLQAYIDKLNATEGVRTATVNVNDQASGVLDSIANKLRAVARNVVGSVWFSEAEPRQHGGDTKPYQAYLVGEAGPELLFMGGKPGWVMSNAQMRAMGAAVASGAAGSSSPAAAGAAGGGGRSFTLQQTNYISSLDPFEIARQTARENSWAMRTTLGGSV